MILNFNHTPQAPELGDTRSITKFTWLPIIFHNHFIWFEWVTIYKEYISEAICDGFDGLGCFEEHRWITKRIYLTKGRNTYYI